MKAVTGKTGNDLVLSYRYHGIGSIEMIDPSEDYYGWTQETIEKLRRGRLSEVSTEDLIEELEGMSKSERRALKSRLTVLLMHLLKWRYQPQRRGKSWRLTIKGQRVNISQLLKDSPSLKSQLSTIGIEAYESAVIDAARETDLDEDSFPSAFEDTGWRWEQVLDREFYPD